MKLFLCQDHLTDRWHIISAFSSSASAGPVIVMENAQLQLSPHLSQHVHLSGQYIDNPFTCANNSPTNNHQADTRCSVLTPSVWMSGEDGTSVCFFFLLQNSNVCNKNWQSESAVLKAWIHNAGALQNGQTQIKLILWQIGSVFTRKRTALIIWSNTCFILPGPLVVVWVMISEARAGVVWLCETTVHFLFPTNKDFCPMNHLCVNNL